ncbi:ascorbate 6-phosphate lactonase [Erysipelothrix larvae]|uniref:Ascorbate 6-phosphate lactonase n=1 Tax=Erysipelothrix larvae TaxID=1514105 RepID=A0A0X8GYE0_9FIRM|nr:L-ascorbate 6-phosphate lactonase [Erysipelothrix larvae]AMC92704.1 ascorbate 6-phosphate lactonase [Erysipelothrix larvae]
MPKIKDITRESWILGAFPEWGTWLNEEIDETVVDKNTFAMWWIGCTGVWFKTENNTNIAIDLWFGNGKRTQKKKEMDPFHQMRNMTGGRMTQPNLRAAPIVFDPFAVTHVDAVLSTHYHNDHIDPFFAAAVLENISEEVPFIGPQESVNKWLGYGVPASRCVVVKPGDVIKVKDTEIHVVDSFDRTCLVTADEDIRGVLPDNMDEKAVNYVIKMPAGTVYHSGDSHYSVQFKKHGNDYPDIDVAFGSFGENPIGNQDKMTSIDLLRMAEALDCKVLIPLHYDVWTNFKADPKEIAMLYEAKKYALQYKFKPFIWDVGGKFVWPVDKDKREYHYRRGFEDAFTDEPNVPFKSIL